MNAARVQVRTAVASDLDAVVALERVAENAPHWPEATYAAILSSQSAEGAPATHRCLIVAEADDELVGFAVGVVQPAGDAPGMDRLAELESVVVAVDARRAGIGRALCGTVLEWCRMQGAAEVVLEVRAASSGAIALYEGLGFKLVGRRPRYYCDPEDDALMMRLRPR